MTSRLIFLVLTAAFIPSIAFSAEKTVSCDEIEIKMAEKARALECFIDHPGPGNTELQRMSVIQGTGYGAIYFIKAGDDDYIESQSLEQTAKDFGFASDRGSKGSYQKYTYGRFFRSEPSLEECYVFQRAVTINPGNPPTGLLEGIICPGYGFINDAAIMDFLSSIVYPK